MNLLPLLRRQWLITSLTLLHCSSIGTCGGGSRASLYASAFMCLGIDLNLCDKSVYMALRMEYLEICAY